MKLAQRVKRLERRSRGVPKVALVVTVKLKPGDDRDARVAEEVRLLEEERGYPRRRNEALIVVESTQPKAPT